MRRLSMLGLGVWLAVSLFSGLAAAQEQPDTQTVIYSETSEDFPNPERGFFDQTAPLWLGEERLPQEVETLVELRERGISLARWYFLLDEFRESPISEDTLAYIGQQFSNAREAGIKVIPRFAYNFPLVGEYPYQEPDATLTQTLAHIAQLTPLLTENADVIAYLEMGFVGA